MMKNLDIPDGESHIRPSVVGCVNWPAYEKSVYPYSIMTLPGELNGLNILGTILVNAGL